MYRKCFVKRVNEIAIDVKVKKWILKDINRYEEQQKLMDKNEAQNRIIRFNFFTKHIKEEQQHINM